MFLLQLALPSCRAPSGQNPFHRALIGPLANLGSGRGSDRFTLRADPCQATVRSTLGGSATVRTTVQ